MYKIAATLVGLPNVLFGLLWCLDPSWILSVWGTDDSSHQMMVERRLGILLLGIGVMLLASRNAEPSRARSAISYGIILSASSLVALSLYDVAMNGIARGVLPGAVVNVATALAFAFIEWRTYRDSKRATGA
jgi:hypothetical protein